MPLNNVSGEVIRKLRHYKGWGQKDACRKLNISQQAYSKIERQNIITHKMLLRIFTAFDCTVEELTKFIPPKNE